MPRANSDIQSRKWPQCIYQIVVSTSYSSIQWCHRSRGVTANLAPSWRLKPTRLNVTSESKKPRFSDKAAPFVTTTSPRAHVLCIGTLCQRGNFNLLSTLSHQGDFWSSVLFVEILAYVRTMSLVQQYIYIYVLTILPPRIARHSVALIESPIKSIFCRYRHCWGSTSISTHHYAVEANAFCSFRKL